MTSAPSTYPEDQTVIESDPVRVIHRRRVHVYVKAHSRGDVSVMAHWRPTPQGVAEPTNFEPAELFKGKQS
jgi:hypothetical protein